MMIKARRCVSAVLIMGVFTAILAMPETCPAGVEGDVELLELVARGITTNREKLQTWRGKARYTTTMWGSGYEEFFDRSILTKSVDFAYSGPLQATRWTSLVTESSYEKDGQHNVDSATQNRLANGIVKDDLVCQITSMGSSEKRSLMCIIQSTEGIKPKPYDFNPTSYFTVSDRDMPKLLMAYKGWVDIPTVNASVTHSGNLVTLEVDKRVLHRYTFDLSQGCNLVEWNYDDKEGTVMTWKFEYENAKGVFVPRKATSERSETLADGLLRFDNLEVVFEGNVVNEPLPEGEFTLASIGMLPGDEVQDLRTGTFYIYKSKEKPLQPAFVGGILEDLEELPSDEPPVAAVAEAPTPEPPTAAGAPQVEAPEGRSFLGPLALVGAAILLAVALLARRTTKK